MKAFIWGKYRGVHGNGCPAKYTFVDSVNSSTSVETDQVSSGPDPFSLVQMEWMSNGVLDYS